MGFLGSIRRRVNSPLSKRRKNKRLHRHVKSSKSNKSSNHSHSPSSSSSTECSSFSSLKFSSTSDFTEDGCSSSSSSLYSMTADNNTYDSSFRRRALSIQRHNHTSAGTDRSMDPLELLDSHSSDEDDDMQELLSPHPHNEGNGHRNCGGSSGGGCSFVFDPILVSSADDENDTMTDESKHTNNFSLTDIQHAAGYIRDDGDTHRAEQQPSPLCSRPALIRSHTPPSNKLVSSHAPHKRSDGSSGQHQQHVMHIFHDELATLYEEPNKSSDTLSSCECATSCQTTSNNNNDSTGATNSAGSSTRSIATAAAAGVAVSAHHDSSSLLDESNIRARWEYALKLMVGQCSEPSELFYNSLVEMIPSSSSGNAGVLPALSSSNTCSSNGTGVAVDMDIAEI